MELLLTCWVPDSVVAKHFRDVVAGKSKYGFRLS